MLAVLLVVPFGVFADEAKEEAKDEVVESKEVKLYLFYGEGCGFCQKDKAWFAEIEEDYGDEFEEIMEEDYGENWKEHWDNEWKAEILAKEEELKRKWNGLQKINS